MKNIFRKNQVIITALAIMIAVAGYLNFSQGSDENALEQQAGTEDGILQTSANMEGNLEDVADADDLIDESMLDISEEDVLAEKSSVDDKKEGNKKETEKEKEGEEPKATSSEEKEKESKEKQVAGNDDTVGEAVLANNTLNTSFISNARLSREQTRAKNKELLMEVIENNSISEKQKQEAIDTMINMTAIAEKENAAEMVLEAKGYQGAVVRISNEEVNVVVGVSDITKQQIVQIEDIVKRNTGADAENIVIIPSEAQ